MHKGHNQRRLVTRCHQLADALADGAHLAAALRNEYRISGTCVDREGNRQAPFELHHPLQMHSSPTWERVPSGKMCTHSPSLSRCSAACIPGCLMPPPRCTGSTLAARNSGASAAYLKQRSEAHSVHLVETQALGRRDQGQRAPFNERVDGLLGHPVQGCNTGGDWSFTHLMLLGWL